MINLTKMKNTEIRKDLTKQEFEFLANRKPNLDGNWLYKYENWQYDDEEIESLYPKFRVDSSCAYFFTSLDDAQAHLQKLVEDNKKGEYSVCYYRHVITQIPIGKNAYHSGATWLYDGDGTLVDYSIVTQEGDIYDHHYFGRSNDRLRFKRGDIVEVMGHDNEVYLSLLIGDVPDVEWCWEYYQRLIRKDRWYGYALDTSDETCYLIDGPGEEWHSHVSPLDIMKPHFPIPEEIRKEMMGWLEAYTNQKGPVDDNRPRRHLGWQLDEINETGIYIHFNEPTDVPHLHIADKVGLVDYAFRIDNGEPYIHDDVAGIMPDKLLNKLQEYLEEKEIGKTRWWYILRQWNDDNSFETNIPLDTPVPKLKKQS